MAVCIERVRPRKKGSAKQWRDLLKQKEIKVYSVFQPHPTAVELLIAKEDENKMSDFMKEIDRKPAELDPFIRRDGKNLPLEEFTKKSILKSLTRMLHFEQSLIGVKYLKEMIILKLQQVEDNEMKIEIKKELEDLIKQ